MKYKTLEDVRLPVSRIAFGTAIDRLQRGERANELLDFALECGINIFDTARVYDHAEEVLGQWIEERGIRSQVVIMTKGVHPRKDETQVRVTPKAIMEDVADSLRALRTDFIDIYLLHRDDVKQPVGPLMETLNELHSAGKIGVLGCSNWSYERIDMANEYAYSHDLLGFKVSSPGFSLAEQVSDPWGGGCVCISGKTKKSARSWYRDSGVELFAYASLAHGVLSGKYPSRDWSHISERLDQYALKGYCGEENRRRLERLERLAEQKNLKVAQLALAWVLNQSLNPIAICATENIEHLREDVDAVNIRLSEQELLYLSEG